MRKILLLILFVISLSCANTIDTVTEEILDGDYRVTQIEGHDSLPRGIVFNFNPMASKLSGNTGCNDFSAHYNQQGNNLEFSTPMNTRKYCKGKMEVERQILSSFEKVSKLDHNGNEIVIYSNNDVPLITLTKID
ncbi:META domain-containing protein [Salinimicrobium tongyeongense]|jgi:heat shock protein HslJ|uniref:META domain-containing protein n=1 Tax=Salinimicrobium tongyeongense TaxID=2809707 RepID=A0ABY6NU65_9FLAO|nr:META domain-containing protein [Salinimicrobium tongyeongense]UZH56459.1 META domain-containing protein [Salinimicrobium tongyeongense]